MNAHTGHLCSGGFLMTKMQDYIPLYTHPAEHDLAIAEAIGFDKGYKAATAKTLTDEEILQLWVQKNTLGGAQNIVDFARAILRKAQDGHSN